MCVVSMLVYYASSQTQLPIDVLNTGDHPDWRRHLTCIIRTHFRGVIVNYNNIRIFYIQSHHSISLLK